MYYTNMDVYIYTYIDTFIKIIHTPCENFKHHRNKYFELYAVFHYF